MQIFIQLWDFLRIYRISVYILVATLLYLYWKDLPIVQNHLILDPRIIVGSAFMLTLIWGYIFNKIYDRQEDIISQPSEIIPYTHQPFVRYFLWVLLPLPAIILIFFQMPVWPYFLYILLSILYSYPIYNGLRAKNILIVKNLLATSTVLSPIVFGVYIYFTPFYALEFTYPLYAIIPLMLFYISGEILWDIRDVKGDTVSNVTTLPVLFGITYTKCIILVLISLAWLIAPYSTIYILPIFLLAIFTIFASPDRPNWFFHIYLLIMTITLLLQPILYSYLS